MIDFLENSNARTPVKICGITQLDQGLAIAEMGADAIGINFWPRSKRYVDPAANGAAEWLVTLAETATIVGVFVNEPTDSIIALHDAGLLHAAQLHGDESPDEITALLTAGVPTIKALGIKDETSVSEMDQYGTRYLLMDAYLPGEYGGGGATFNWDLARNAIARFPDHRIALSGGLNPTNAAAAASEVRPAALDLASGVESSPGIKDLAKVQAVLDAVC